MKLTNKQGLPEPIVNAIRQDPYIGGTGKISVTRLLQPPQLRHLSELHAGELVEDAADRIWALLGQATHTILERAFKGTEAIVEKRLYKEVEGWVVSGQFDVLEPDGTLSDYKITSVYAREAKPEWIAQLNMLRALAEDCGDVYEVKKLQVVAIYRDWRPKEALREDYPDSQVAILPIPLWTLEKANEYLTERVRLHQSATPQPCTDEERWHQADKWALRKKGQKKAVKLFDAKPENIILTEGQYWEHRPGSYRRCESYCSVSRFCPQWQAEQLEVAA